MLRNFSWFQAKGTMWSLKLSPWLVPFSFFFSLCKFWEWGYPHWWFSAN